MAYFTCRMGHKRFCSYGDFLNFLSVSKYSNQVQNHKKREIQTPRFLQMFKFMWPSSGRHQTAVLQGHRRTSRPPSPLTALLQVTNTAFTALLRCEFWAVFTRMNSALRAANFYYFAVTLKHAIWWRPLQWAANNSCGRYARGWVLHY
jgi:hypothetical protein